MQSKRIAFVVGHESWGKTYTLRALINICQGSGHRVTIDEVEFLLRMTSNDDRPNDYRRWMGRITRPHIIAALCPKFARLENYERPQETIETTLRTIQDKGYRMFFWVIEHKWHDDAIITPRELSELRRYGRVEVFSEVNAEAERRARHLRSFISQVVVV